MSWREIRGRLLGTFAIALALLALLGIVFQFDGVWGDRLGWLAVALLVGFILIATTSTDSYPRRASKLGIEPTEQDVFLLVRIPEWEAKWGGSGEEGWDSIAAVRAEKGPGYRAYLTTPEWQARRKLALNTAGNRCQVCNGYRGLEVHHRSYDRAGSEQAGDLIVLCRDCHSLFHEHRNVL